MTFAVTDNDQMRLEQTTQLIKDVFPDCVIHTFTDPMLSAKCALEPQVDAVFAEVRMRPVNGFDLLHVLHVNRPRLPVFLISDDAVSREAALKKGASDYLVRPLSTQGLLNAVHADDSADYETEFNAPKTGG